MKIIYNSWFPFGGYHTINLFGILFTKKKLLDQRSINHEAIHSELMKELLFIGFYLWYLIEYLIVRCFHKRLNTAYHDISFEEEACSNDDNKDYLKSRKHYSWLRFLRLRSIK